MATHAPSAGPGGPLTIGMLQPGAMGVTVAASAIATGHRVIWAGAGRSAASHRRADDAGLIDVNTLDAVCESSDHIFSVCPPHAALAQAEAVIAAGFKGVFTDGNAVSPATAAEVSALIENAGCDYVDGGIIGPPAHQPGSTRMYLSGPRATSVATLLTGGLLPGIAISERCGDASALKMAYASFTKGTSALLLATRAMARAYNVESHLLDEWTLSQPDLPDRCQGEGRVAAKKAWRFSGEMREIADSMQAVQLPADFHLGAADLYDRLEQFRSGEQLPALDDVLDALLNGSTR